MAYRMDKVLESFRAEGIVPTGLQLLKVLRSNGSGESQGWGNGKDREEESCKAHVRLDLMVVV
jgi:hypothetical protein